VRVARTAPNAGDYVSYIELTTQMEKGVITLGQLLKQYGVPARVFRNPVAGPNTVNLLLVFGERHQIFAALSIIGIATDNSPIDTLILASPQEREVVLDDLRTQWHYDTEISWLGFQSADSYWKEKGSGG
jgi:hypothetical protein